MFNQTVQLTRDDCKKPVFEGMGWSDSKQSEISSYPAPSMELYFEREQMAAHSDQAKCSYCW